jgi:hypothetical protein
MTFTPSEMRRMSTLVTELPLPGWTFSANSTTCSLPSCSTTLPLRSEEAITLTMHFFLVQPAAAA